MSGNTHNKYLLQQTWFIKAEKNNLFLRQPQNLAHYVIVPIHAMKAEGEVESFFTLALEEGGWSASWPGWCMPERATLHTEEKAGLAPELVWTFLRGVKSLAPIGNGTSDRPAHSLVTTLTELPWLTNRVIMSIILQFL